MIFDIIKKFVIAWIVIFGILVICSCVMYKDAIAYAVSNNIWAMVNCIMPPLIIIFGIIYAIRSALK